MTLDGELVRPPAPRGRITRVFRDLVRGMHLPRRRCTLAKARAVSLSNSASRAMAGLHSLFTMVPRDCILGGRPEAVRDSSRAISLSRPDRAGASDENGWLNPLARSIM